MESIFRNERFDICINAAGNGSVAFSIGNPKTDFEANTYHVIKILDAIRMYQSECKFLQISSVAVYGNPIKLPINECDNLNPLSAYGFNKLMSEMICKEYHTLYNLPIAIIRPFLYMV
ncbi:MAG: SDR family oxidoreductase [Saprospiraceae bacterium]|nr:SDR family oxidoreductase [Saprospiraceae bacterium]